MQAAPLLRHRRDILDALIVSATDPDPKSHPDRKLALEMLGDYKPRGISGATLSGAGELVLVLELADLLADSGL